MMLIDVSELKSYRDCQRKWALSSRNKLHLRTKVPAAPLAFGTAFHTCLEQMYRKNDLDIESFRGVVDAEGFEILANIVKHYYYEVIPRDLERYEVLETEHKFKILLTPEITATGSIDMVVREKTTGKIYGFEHKTCKAWRPEIYDQLDEQPQMYSIALIQDFGQCDGIFINEVKKLKTKLEYKRVKCTYTQEELDEFIHWVLADAESILRSKEGDRFRCSPNFMSCQMCDFQPLCLEMRATSSISAVTPELIDRYDYKVRERDHLEEK